MSERDPAFERAVLRADIKAGNTEAAKMQLEQMSDPYAKGGHRHWFWWADASYLAPGLHFRHRRLLPVSLWISRPRYSWRVRR